MALLAIERGAENLHLVFADTGHEHRQTYQYVDYLEHRLGVKIERVKADFTRVIAGKRAYMLERLAQARSQKIKRRDLPKWLEAAAASYPAR